jgi:hypothetical protein
MTGVFEISAVFDQNLATILQKIVSGLQKIVPGDGAKGGC